MKKLNLLVLFALLSLPSGEVAKADDAAVTKYKDFTPEQIKQLPEAVQKSDLPVMYSQATNTALAPWANDLFAMQLNTLFYNGIGDLGGAIWSFQSDVGDQPTGKLTVWQIFQLRYRSEMQKASPPSIYQTFASNKSSDAAFIKGTTTIVDERPAWPINYTRMNCYKSDGYCELEELSVQPPTDKDWVYNFSVIWNDPLYYKITSWSEDVIQAV